MGPLFKETLDSLSDASKVGTDQGASGAIPSQLATFDSEKQIDLPGCQPPNFIMESNPTLQSTHLNF